jgi:hypothetical protein
VIQDRLEHQPIVTEPVPRTEAIVFLLSVVLIVTTAFVSPSVYNISLVFFAYSVGIGASAVLLSAGSSGVLRMFWPAIPFVLLQAFSGFWSANPNSTVSYALMFAGMLMFGMMSHHSTNGGYHKGLLRVVGVVVLLVSLYGIYQYFYGFERSSEYLRKFGESELGLAGTGVERTLAALAYKRAFSTFMSSNVLASFLACALPLIGYLFLSSKNAGSRIFHGAWPDPLGRRVPGIRHGRSRFRRRFDRIGRTRIEKKTVSGDGYCGGSFGYLRIYGDKVAYRRVQGHRDLDRRAAQLLVWRCRYRA